MFAGIVETIGTIVNVNHHDGCTHFSIKPKDPFQGLTVGDSIAVNGVCLTITKFNADTFNVTLVPETLRLTNLKHKKTGDMVNLEQSLTLDKRIGGHYVQGHVDGTGKILAIESDNGRALLITISLPPALSKYIVKKGYITLDGMSITVINIENDNVTVTLIPHTQAVTISKHYQLNDEINIETDIMGKYIQKAIGAYIHDNQY